MRRNNWNRKQSNNREKSNKNVSFEKINKIDSPHVNEPLARESEKESSS